MHVLWFNNGITALLVIAKHHGNHSWELKPRKTDINFDEVLKGGMRKE